MVEQANGKNGNATRSEGGNVTFSSDTDVTLNAITTDSFCTLGTCTGNWMVQSRTAGTKINIAQADNTHLTIHGTTDFTINGGTINLGNRDNIFGTQGGSVEAQAGNAVSKTLTLGTVGNTTVSGLGLLLGAADINGTARLTATSPTASVNAITQAPNTSLTVTGSTELTANTIALENNGNDFSIINSLDAATSVRVFDSANDLVLNTLKTPNLTLNTLGDAHFNGTIITNDKSVSITQNGAGAVALADSLTQAGTGAVTFNGTVLSAGFKLLSNQNAAWDLAAKTLVWDSKTFGFEGFTRLIGGAGVDTVRLSTSVNAIDLDNQSSTGFVLSNMEVIKATAANASLKGFKANSQWTITGDKKGTIVGGGQTTAFEGFNELISSDDASNTDLFTFNSAGAIGKITGQNADVVNLFPGTDGAGVDYDWAVTANTLNGSTTASAQVKRSGQSTDVIAALTGVGTINSSDGKDTVTASATYAGTIDLKAGVNALTTDSARLLFSSRPLNMNGFVGVNDLNAKTQAATLTASTDDVSAILAWAVNPAEDALKGPLSGSITYAQSGQADQTLSFKGFATLTGGANNDYFTLNNVALNTGTFTGGQINAGTPASAATQDRLINAVDGTVWDLSTASLRGVTFSGFNYWQGSGTDTLKGMNATNYWVINSGQSTLNNATQFSGFTVINGGSGKDIFTLNASAAAITLRGNAGADDFILADSSIQTGTLDGGAGVDVDSENDTLKINSGTNAWVVTAPGTGTVNNNVFSGMEILAGGTGSDTLDNQITNQVFVLTGVGAGILQSKTPAPPSIAVTVTGMDTIKNTDALKGLDSGTLTWGIKGADTGTIKNIAQHTLINFERVAQLMGGNATNIFDITSTGAPLTLSIVGGEGVNTVHAPNTINTWNMSGATSGVAASGGATGLSFKGIQKISGGTQHDTLDYSAVPVTTPLIINAADLTSIEAVNGNGASVVVQAGDGSNTWTFNDANGGALNNTLAFSQMAGVRGGAGKDSFIFTPTSAFNGTLDGGTQTPNSAPVLDELSVDAQGSDFLIQAQGEGVLTFKNLINISSQVAFTGIEVLNGGEAVDRFRFSSALTDGANLNMLLDGKGNQDSIELPNIQLDIALAAGVERTGNKGLVLAHFESIAADERTDSSLRAASGTALWAIDGRNTGVLTLTEDTLSSVTRFSGFLHLYGSSGVDTFNFNTPDAQGVVRGLFTGTIAGGAEDRIMARDAANEWTLTAASEGKNTLKTQAGELYIADFAGVGRLHGGSEQDHFTINGNQNTISIFGGAGNDIFTLGDSGFIKEINGEAGMNTLEGRRSGAIAWNFTAVASGQLKEGALLVADFNGIQNVKGRSASDTVNYFSSPTGARVKTWEYDRNQFNVLEDTIALVDMEVINAGADADVIRFKAAFNGVFNAGGGSDTLELLANGSVAS
ncbi:MAG TPA: hypothetical protein PKC70_06760, partial [Cellvibrionaceae bacterium]|nr:hypothetical protein [Cellvibrionaceae bacterium]